MDDVPDGRDDEVTRTDVPVTRPEVTGPASGQVRIVGAEPAGESTAELPLVSRHDEPPAGDRDESVGEDRSPVEPLPLSEEAFGQPTVRLTDERGIADGEGDVVNPVSPGETAVPSGTPTELPHWTEPPTGQVPAVLARDNGDDSQGPGIAGPTWREEDSDWVGHDELFGPETIGAEDVALGSLDETNRTDVERRPWEFDLDPATSGQRHVTGVRSSERGSADEDPITEPVDVVPTSPDPVAPEDPPARSLPTGRPSGARSSAITAASGAVGAAAGAASSVGDRDPDSAPDQQHTSSGGSPLFPEDDDAIDEMLADDKPLPSGSARMGRARRSGLLPARLRAKRPEDAEDVTDAPLAAEPPGASVTDVPGAGRKRRGLASLAAADRTAERVGDLQADDSAATPEALAADPPASEEVGDSTPGNSARRSFRRPGSATAPAAAAGAVAVDRTPTGGGPPPRVEPRRPKGTGPGGIGSAAGAGSVGLRVGTGLAVAVVALLAFKLGTVPSLVLVVIVVTFAAGECFGVLRRAGYHPATLLGLVGTISLTVGAYSKGIAALPLVMVLIVAFTLVWYLFGIERGSPVAGTAATLLTVGWVSLLGAYAGLLLSPSTFPDRHGIAFLLGAIIATVANDVGALVVGGWMGRTPLAPTISPNKTWEGLFGGAVFSILVSTVAVGSIHPWSASNAALLGVVVAVVAPIGDLCESLLKRDLRIKDMGTLLPGHGGVLDRVDALLFVLPATYYLVRALNIG